MKKTDKNSDMDTLNKVKSFFKVFKENVKEGAETVAETIKDKSAQAYVAGTELIEETNEKIHTYTDKISLEKEIKRLEKEKDYYVSMFGSLTLKHYIANGNLHKAFLSTEIIEETKEKYLEIEKKIKSLNRQLKKLKSE